eukprot:TRINITY_DN52184_c0_g1_i1.p1 TRINITY_DN52184_c0_g1~~TRINITY_DN52184_c0_g1_i1.p1  ORF type:complete len:231 (+),score=27.01 TRINITY_DN52184_c0_g1_i1:105-695(+)
MAASAVASHHRPAVPYGGSSGCGGSPKKSCSTPKKIARAPDESPLVQHAARDLREPVSRTLASAGCDSRGGVSPDMPYAERFPSAEEATSQDTFLSPVLPCSSPIDLSNDDCGLAPIRSDGDRRLSASSGPAHPMFGGSLVEPASLLGSLSPSCTHAPAGTAPLPPPCLGAVLQRPEAGRRVPPGEVTPGDHPNRS